MSAVDPSLPQHSTDVHARTRALEKVRSEYDYEPRSGNVLAPVAVAGKFPWWENYLLDWAIPYLPHLVQTLISTNANKLYYGIRKLFGPYDKYTAYLSLFNPGLDLPVPPPVQDWDDDGAFARRWVDGPNPLTIERVTSAAHLASRLTITEAQFQTALAGPRTLLNEIADGKLFLVDYGLLEKSLIPPSPVHRDTRWRAKYLPAPVVLLCERPGVEAVSDLVAVAITIDQQAATPPNPLYLRGGGVRWQLAKSYVNVADYNLQLMSIHIYRHHYTAEPVAITTRRQLAEVHPMLVLLEPHIRYTISVNHQAFDLMKTAGSAFDTLYAGELSETINIMRVTRARSEIHQLRLPVDLATRGVTTQPAYYPWREDAILWKDALDRYADTTVRLYYATDAEVAGDWELQNWFEELSGDDRGALRGLTPSHQLQTVDELIGLFAQLLFTCGPGHAAVHFPQTDYFTYVPMYPGAAYLPPPDTADPVDAQRLTDMLPPYDVGAVQFQTNQMAYFRFDKFGDFGAYRVSKVAAVQPAIARLRQDLAGIEVTIQNRNQSRPRPYIYMLPSLVPNSINV